MFTLSRRDFLAAAAFLAARANGASGAPTFFRRSGLAIGLQLYTVGDDLNRDFDGTLAAVAKIGYRSVELAGLSGHTVAEWRQSLDRNQLKCPSMHAPPHDKSGISLDDPGALADAAHALGAGTIICPIFNLPERFSPTPLPGEDGGKMLARLGASMTPEDWKRNAEYLNIKGKALKQHGLRFGYHNHNVELAPLGTSTGLAELIRGTDPALVTFEMDAGWVVAAGADPLALLAAYPGRFSAMHVKDVKAGTQPNFSLRMDPCEVGQGTIDWKVLLAKAYAANVRQFYVEQEPPFNKPRLESVAISFDYLNGLVA
ncbi:MAG TPA: sugar phosphate isomerase/epimerase [Steroidobacteraceae bacterium]|nr:sugar phosphate isomerase/epimerase [Steroidobacteraceae bacterium]